MTASVAKLRNEFEVHVGIEMRMPVQ